MGVPALFWSCLMSLKIKTLIVEDEPPSQERLLELLQGIDSLEILDIAKDGIEAVEKINGLKPELVFLDIRMPGANGFEVLERISHRPMVIFLTAYDEYAIKAFEENAVDYLLKPSSGQRIAEAVRKVMERCQRISPELLETLKKSLENKKYLKRFAVKQGDEVLIIPEEDVCYFQAEHKYVFLYTLSRRCIFDMTLKELDDYLDPDCFCRIHKSTIVSLTKISRLKKWFKGEYLIQFEDFKRSKLKVSRSYVSLLKEKLNLI